jgi:hypothetical protein
MARAVISRRRGPNIAYGWPEECIGGGRREWPWGWPAEIAGPATG